MKKYLAIGMDHSGCYYEGDVPELKTELFDLCPETNKKNKHGFRWDVVYEIDFEKKTVTQI